MIRDEKGTKKAVVLLSGGIDSATTLFMAKAEGYELFAMTFDYCQRHRRELESARTLARAADVKKHLVVAFDMGEIGGSSLTADIAVPKHGANAPPDSGPPETAGRAVRPIPSTYVPARNTIFLSFALGWAEVLGADSIFIGANAVDYSGYPDCRPEYLAAFENMANRATRASVEGKITFRINAPLLFLRKSEIIAEGIRLGVDYALTWSCYDPQPLDAEAGIPPLYAPCGACDSCRYRAMGFRAAGIEDPLLARTAGE